MTNTLWIDGIEVEFQAKQTVLQVARDHGFYIPTLCFHPRTGPASMCRVCVVELEGARALQPACTLLPTPGMKVQTASPRVLEARRMVVNLLLANGSHDCLSCEVNGACELQDAAYHLGIESPAFLVEEWEPRDSSAAFIIRDPNKCILCGRCILGCNEQVVNEVLDFGYRGAHTKVICDADLPMGQSTCVQCGECVQLCPVGVFIEKKGMGKARRWETRVVRTTCPYCGVGCQLDLHIKGEEIIRVTGVEGAEPNQGHLCVKGRYGYDYIYSADRLTTPLIREGKTFRQASWDEALDLVVGKFQQIIEESGPDALAGVSSSRTINEDSYYMQRLFREVIGTNNIDNCARV
jgi:formate dehydrogenase major subunit